MSALTRGDDPWFAYLRTQKALGNWPTINDLTGDTGPDIVDLVQIVRGES